MPLIASRPIVALRQLASRIFERLVHIATDPNDTEEWRLRKVIGLTAACGGVVVLFGYGFFFILFNERLVGLSLIACATLLLLDTVVFGFSRRYDTFFWVALPIPLLSPFAATLLLGGFSLTGSIIVWTLLAPLLVLIGHDPRRWWIWFLAVAMEFVLVGVLQPFLRVTNNLPSNAATILFVVNTISFAGLAFSCLFYFVYRNEILTKLIRREQERAESLLLNILPKEIATILKDGSRVIADYFGEASVLFADIVDFTLMSAQMTPSDCVELLNEVFSEFDVLAEKHGLEKIKTIGDCYMVAAGIPRSRSDHAHVLARMALDIGECVNKREFRGKRLRFRIGINSGPVVAGVIGRKKFIYDLWGDAVNTASRMESRGVEGVIQVTDATYQLIKDDFECQARGTIDVKGKGEMRVWYLLRERAVTEQAAFPSAPDGPAYAGSRPP